MRLAVAVVIILIIPIAAYIASGDTAQLEETPAP